jgi:hypothetical protein
MIKRLITRWKAYRARADAIYAEELVRPWATIPPPPEPEKRYTEGWTIRATPEHSRTEPKGSE